MPLDSPMMFVSKGAVLSNEIRSEGKICSMIVTNDHSDEFVTREKRCQNISIDVKCDILGCKGETVASCNFSENESELYYLMKSLHIMNEIVSYNISEFWTLISVSTIFLLTLMYMVVLKG